MTTVSMDPGLLDMLRTSLRAVLTEDSDLPFADRLHELGWGDVVADDAATAWQTLFEIKGETAASVDALGPALAAALADAVAEPRLTAAIVGLDSPHGATIAGDTSLDVETMALSTPTAGASIAVPVDDGRVAVVSADDLVVEPVGGTDTDLGAVRLRGTAANADVEWLDGAVWDTVVTRGRWLVACELVGIARHVVAAAVAYTGDRVQYGKPIGVFQALQHRAADAHSLTVGAGHLAKEAGITADPWTAMVAKCLAGRSAEFACTQAQQCYGAIGFTWEHEFHRYLRRTYALDRLFGDWRALEHEIGERLQSSGRVPAIGVL